MIINPRDKITGRLLSILTDIECIICQSIFRPINSKVRCCSCKCAAKMRAKKQKKIISKNCEICDIIFYGQLSYIKKKKFCSHKCSNSRRKNKDSRIIKNCKNCKKEYLTYDSYKTNFCSISCSKLGKPSWNKGKKMTERSGANHYNWKGGKEYARHIHTTATFEYRNWRKSVFERDDWKCRIADEKCKGQLQAHHILGWADYPELRYEINNGITLCQAHHPRKRAEEKRLSPYFTELVSVSKESQLM